MGTNPQRVPPPLACNTLPPSCEASTEACKMMCAQLAVACPALVPMQRFEARQGEAGYLSNLSIAQFHYVVALEQVALHNVFSLALFLKVDNSFLVSCFSDCGYQLICVQWSPRADHDGGIECIHLQMSTMQYQSHDTMPHQCHEHRLWECAALRLSGKDSSVRGATCHLPALTADDILVCMKVPQSSLKKPGSWHINFKTILELAGVVKIRYLDNSVIPQWPCRLLTNVEDFCQQRSHRQRLIAEQAVVPCE